MTTGLDTSVVLRLLTGVPAEQAELARVFVSSQTSPVLVSDLVVGETYFALKHHYGAPHQEAVRSLSALLADARLQGSGVAHAVLAALALRPAAKNAPGLLDRLIHADYDRDANTLATFDKDLSRLPNVHLLA